MPVPCSTWDLVHQCIMERIQSLLLDQISLALLLKWSWASTFSLIVSHGLHTSFKNSLVQKKRIFMLILSKASGFVCVIPSYLDHESMGLLSHLRCEGMTQTKPCPLRYNKENNIPPKRARESLGLPSPQDFPRASPTGNSSGKTNSSSLVGGICHSLLFSHFLWWS